MTLQEANTLFESLKSDTTKKHEIKVYEAFTEIIAGLEKREFAESEILAIALKLDSLNLTAKPKNRKRYYRKALREFEKFLIASFSLTVKGYYTKLGTAFGISFGLLFGLIFLSSWERSMGISLGMLLGMVIGLTIGRSMDAKAITEDRVL